MNHISSALLQTTRRSYVLWLLGLCGSAATAVASIPLIRFALFPLTTRPSEIKWSDVGAMGELVGSTAPLTRTIALEQIDGWRKSISDKVVYLTKDGAGNLCALSAVCPHLGCSVQWQESKDAFVCPCHGGSYKADGTRIGGPAARGLDSLETKVEGGKLFVRYETFRQLIPTKEAIS